MGRIWAVLEIKHTNMKNVRDTIRESVIKLGLPIAVCIDATKYCAQMQSAKTHDFALEILECASIYLATKVNEEYRRLRGSVYLFRYQ